MVALLPISLILLGVVHDLPVSFRNRVLAAFPRVQPAWGTDLNLNSLPARVLARVISVSGIHGETAPGTVARLEIHLRYRIRFSDTNAQCQYHSIIYIYVPDVSPGGNPEKSTWSCTVWPCTENDIRSRRRTALCKCPRSGYDGRSREGRCTSGGATTRICCVSVAPGLMSGLDMGSICNCCDCMRISAFLSRHQGARARTFGTAAWKFSPVTGVFPATWNRARMFTTPGRWGFVCGVNDMRSSFLSYAGYAVSCFAAGCGGAAWVCGNENAEGAVLLDGERGLVAAAADTEGVGEPKRDMMSSTALVGCCAGAAGALLPEDEEPPKISARRASLLDALACPFGAAVVSSDPSKSASWFCVDPTGLFSLTVVNISTHDA